MTPQQALLGAMKLMGGQSALARAIGVTPQAVHNWRQRKHVTPAIAIAIERATKGKVARGQLRPDLW